MKKNRKKLNNIPDPLFFKNLLGRVCGEHWADEFFAKQIKSMKVSPETLRRWSRILELNPLVTHFIRELQVDFRGTSNEYGTALDEKALEDSGIRIVNNP